MRFLRNFYFPLIIFLISILTYWDLPKTFFQQDEWLIFGKIIVREATGGVGNVLIYPFFGSRGHFTPLAFFQTYSELKLFGLSFEPIAYISIATHIANSLLLFYFMYLLLKNKFLAFCSSIIFSVEVISSQAVTWIGASANTQGAVLFLLLSLIFTLKYLQNNQKRSYYIALVFFFVGLLFKETIVFFFLLAPLLWFLFGQKKGIRQFFLFLKPLIILGFIYFLIRVLLFLIPSPVIVASANTVSFSLVSDITKLLLSPFKMLPQTIFPQHLLIDLSDLTTLFFYPKQSFGGIVNPYFSQTVVFGRVIPYLSIPIILIGLIFYKLLLKRKDFLLSKVVVFSLLFIMFSSFPLAFLPANANGNLPIYESRHLHMAAIGMSIFLTVGLYAVVKFFLKQSKYVFLVLLIMLTPILLIHLTLTRTEIDRVVKVSTVRKNILKSMIRSYPSLPQKVLFYTQSDTAYYGMLIEEKALPVQINFGLMLLVSYQEDENFPPCLFDFNPQAFHMLAQRYIECDGRGFGYFRDYDKLIVAIKENNIPLDNVISYSWNGKEEKLIDVTNQMRIRIKKENSL